MIASNQCPLGAQTSLGCSFRGVVVSVEEPAQILLRVGDEVAVGRVDLRDRRAHDPAQVEELDPRGDRPGGERMPAGVYAPVLDARSPKRRSPMPLPEGDLLQVVAIVAVEDEPGVEATGVEITPAMAGPSVRTSTARNLERGLTSLE